MARQQINPGRSLVLAGMVEGRIAGYLVAKAVDGTAYIDEVFLATESLPTNVGSGLVFEFMQVCRRAGIREVVYGLNSREDAALSRYKHEMGFPVVNVPARIWMLAVRKPADPPVQTPRSFPPVRFDVAMTTYGERLRRVGPLLRLVTWVNASRMGGSNGG